MKILAVLVVCLPIAAPTFAQKMHVKVLTHTVDGTSVVRFVPGIGISNGAANANCAAYGNSANCSGTAAGSSIYVPAHTQDLTLSHIQMLLLLPDGRRVGVSCNDHAVGLAKARIHACKNPEVDEFESDFSGDKVKLTWGVGLDGKKKESETYIVGPVFPAKPSQSSQAPKPPAPGEPGSKSESDSPSGGVSRKQPFAPLESPVPLTQPSNPQPQ
jgi:hypothetical protein